MAHHREPEQAAVAIRPQAATRPQRTRRTRRSGISAGALGVAASALPLAASTLGVAATTLTVAATTLQAAIASVLSNRGAVSVLASTNTLVVTDVPRMHRMVEELLGR